MQNNFSFFTQAPHCPPTPLSVFLSESLSLSLSPPPLPSLSLSHLSPLSAFFSLFSPLSQPSFLFSLSLSEALSLALCSPFSSLFLPLTLSRFSKFHASTQVTFTLLFFVFFFFSPLPYHIHISYTHTHTHTLSLSLSIYLYLPLY